MKLIEEYIEKYSKEHTRVYDADLLLELERKTHLEVMRPQMLSGYLQGQFLSFLSQMKCPDRILELGTYTGYSAICLSMGLQKGGKLHTIDINTETSEVASEYIQKSDRGDCIIQHIGEAMSIIPELKEQWDLVFLDADKINYSKYYDLILPDVKPGGLIIADNVLWNGAAAKGNPEKRAKALAAFNKKVTSDNRVKNILLPLRDGLMLMLKK